MDLLAFFRTAEVLPRPHPNPETGGLEWFHGTPSHYVGDDGDTSDHTSPPMHDDKHDDEYFQHAKDHWNTAIGSHWSGVPETAEFFANGQSHTRTPMGEARVAHAHLHMANPKHYKTEFHMTGDAIAWGKQNGYRHLPDDFDARDSWDAGDSDGMEESGAETRSGPNHQTTMVPYHEHPHIEGRDSDSLASRRSIAEIDDDHEGMTGDELHTKHGAALDTYLGTHPFRSEITEGFVKHLKSQGHDGVTYGNMYEQPIGHTCAIPFSEDQINLKKWRHLNDSAAKKYDGPDYQPPREEVKGQQRLLEQGFDKWHTFDGKTASLQTDATSSEPNHPGRLHPLAHENGEAMHLPTPSALNPEPKGYRPGDDLTGMDKSPHVGWVKTEALVKHREYDRAGDDANPDSRERIDQIRREFRDHGQREPVVLMHDPHSDRAYLGEGNHRLAAAIEEGVPALAVHVTRAYRSESDKMGPQHYLGSHKVMADSYGYTPGSLKPSEALPDDYLYTKPKTAAVTPKPEYDSEADYDTNRDARNNWRSTIRRGLSTGHVSNEDAIASGYTGEGHDNGPDTVFGPRTLGWKPMPDRLYHVTTDLHGVLTHGLKSRDELNQDRGKGLGGGESDTISFTHDHHLAGSILHSMREFHDVVNGKKTPAHMWDEAQTGEGAARPFHEDLEKALRNRWTGGIHPGLRGQKVLSQGGTTPPEPGAEPWSDGDHIDTQKGKWHTHWVRPMTDDEKREHAVDFYKQFSANREWAGGRPDPVFFSTDVEGFRKMDPDNFGIVHVKPKPGAKGYRVHGMGEWRTATGDAVDIVHHQKTAGLHDDYEFTHEVDEYNPDDWDEPVKPGQTPIRDHYIWAHPKHNPNSDYAGYLNWNDHDRFISDVGVQPEHQRKGIATEMLRRAREITPDLRHSTQLSADGEEWARKVGSSEPIVAYHATRSKHWPPKNDFVHVGTPDAALDRAVYEDGYGNSSHDEERYGPENGAHWYMHEAQIKGRTYPHVLTDSAANDLAEFANTHHWDSQRALDNMRPEDAQDIGLPEHPRGYTVFPYTNDNEHSGSTSYLVHPATLKVTKTHDLGPTSYAKTARWLPHDRIFGPGHGGVDPRLFDERKRMRPEVAAVILGDLDAYWHKTYPDWRDWCRVYLAGSEASEWYGNNDFDTLLGVEHKKIRRAHPEFADMLDEDIDAYLTKGLRENLNNEDWIAPWDNQVWHRTYYVNPNSWDIRAIKPYAAYDITRNRWIVEPVHPASDWGPEKLPSSFWDEAESIVSQVHAIEAMPEPIRSGRAAALFSYLHGDRRRAFGPHGTGVYDPGNATWKYLDMHPEHPLSILIDLKKRYEDSVAAEATA